MDIIIKFDSKVAEIFLIPDGYLCEIAMADLSSCGEAAKKFYGTIRDLMLAGF